MAGDVIGREAELAAVGSWLDGLASGPGGLVVGGDAGIGKTTVFRAAVAMARERRFAVLSCRPVQSEAQLSFAALGDLVERILDDVLPELPGPQRRALEIATLRVEDAGDALDERAVSVAALGALRLLARAGRVLVAVDDAGWLDPPSARVVEFAVRRLVDEPVGVLVSVRTGDGDGIPLGLDSSVPPERLRRLRVGPLSLGALSSLLRSRVDGPLPRPTLVRIHETTGGNPFFALELARALVDEGAELKPGQGLPVPGTLRELVERRLARLPSRTRTLLLSVAALSRPTVGLTGRLGDPRHGGGEDLDPAVEAGIIEIEGDRIRFSHPLLGSVLYAGASDPQRRSLHRRLAAVVADPEERARHHALGADGPSVETAGMLDDAARAARSRGAAHSAGELLELAGALTPAPRAWDRWRRMTDAAGYHYEAGNPQRARTLLERALTEMPAGPGRARALLRLATVLHDSDGPARPVSLLRQARVEVGDDLAVRMEIERELAHDLWLGGDARSARRHARAAADLAERLDDRPAAVTARAQELLMASVLDGVTAERLRSVAALGAPEQEAQGGGGRLTNLESVRQTLALMLLMAGEFDQARAIYLEEVRRAVAHGDDWEREYLAWCLARVEQRAGNYDQAARHAEASYTESLGLEGLRCEALYARAAAAAALGQVDTARRAAEEGLAVAERLGLTLAALRSRSVLGFLELSLGNLAAAHRHLGPAAAVTAAMGLGEPGYLPFLPDEVEALIGLGKLDEAEALLAPFEDRAQALDRGSALAAGARCRGLLEAARGDLQRALGTLDRAIATHDRVAEPLERGRTLLAAGAVRRRARKWGAARDLLERARALFEELGAVLWAERTEAELRRVGGRPTRHDQLSPTEERVAELVATGRTNREVADALFLSVNTVEANLSRIYRKLGVRSRTELGAKLRPRRPPAAR